MAFPGGVVLSLLSTLPASCTARLGLQRHHPWFVSSELSVAPLCFWIYVCTPVKNTLHVPSWSMCLLSLCLSSSVFFTPAKSISRDMGQGRARGGTSSSKRKALLGCLSSRQPKGLGPSSSFQAGVVTKLESRFPGAEDPAASSNWVPTQLLRKVLTVLFYSSPRSPSGPRLG